MGFVFTIQELNIDSNFWRIDWFGSVSFSEIYRRSSQPKVEVQLSQILDYEINSHWLAHIALHQHRIAIFPQPRRECDRLPNW
jgi:hypothetical protein